MIPEEIYIKDLLYEREGLPDWFQFVFQKQFLKQKKNFDVVAKKTYKIHGLRQVTNALISEKRRTGNPGAVFQDTLQQIYSIKWKIKAST